VSVRPRGLWLLKWTIGLTFAAAAMAAAVWMLGWLFRPALAATPPFSYSEKELQEVRDLRDTTPDLEKPLVIARDVDYTRGEAAAWYPKGESPLLAELVKEGDLPPVAERVGEEPLVLKAVEGIGRYGGTWRMVMSANATPWLLWPPMYLGYPALVRFSPQGYPLVGHLASSWEVSADSREFTFHLRRGIKWSDGEPFTADDILYWWEAECLDPEISSQPPDLMIVRGEVGSIKKLGPYTLKFSFPSPNGMFLLRLATSRGIWSMPNRPAHYLRPYHPRLGDPALIEAAVKARNMNNARQLYTSLVDVMNPECPRLWPWVCRTYRVGPPYTFVRNPYYFAVDTEGNQLPYIDRILVESRSPDLSQISLANGEVTMQASADNTLYTLLMSQRERYGYDVYHWYPGDRSSCVISPNLNRRIDEDDPSSAWKHKLLNDRRFRRALSYAINREAIIKAQFNGIGEPAQVAPGPASPFYEPSLYRSCVEYNPALANRLLDEAGLTQRDREGFRTFPDGSRMTFYLSYAADSPGANQFVVDDWARVGVRVILRYRAWGLFYNEKAALKHDFATWSGCGEYMPILDPRHFIPYSSESLFAIGYARWVSQGGYYGSERATQGKGFIPVPEESPLYEALGYYDAVFQTADPREQIEQFRKVLKIAADNTWTINIATPEPILIVVKRGMRNVPHKVVSCWPFLTPGNAGAETYYLEQSSDSAGAMRQTKEEIRKVTPSPLSVAGRAEAARVSGTSGVALGRILRYGFWAIGFALLLMVAVRHPYIGRRLLIMVPTLLIISVVSFTVIQLPPGNYLTTLITQMEDSGSEVSLRQVEELKEAFFLEDPLPVQYGRWLGLKWFTTLKPEDRGLLQGQMGRSMVSNQPVNDIVGDRIVLTVLISLGTILFTWAIALPIGIYSAVRKYSVGDYVLTFVGFIGMCVPPFLLALLLMFFSSECLGLSVSGLFSAQYGADPDWSLGKVLDLLKHIWIPITVLGVGGTAGMIRVMRANLLDELSKPYVTTARAKGVRPLRLLLKYPVRIALNPFISGIGGLFPQLVSGGAIVAMVLSLPTVGPLLLDALMQEDMYLAGSMLMVLSVLGVFGTLVSDLLLLWLDPRIRFQGGSK